MNVWTLHATMASEVRATQAISWLTSAVDHQDHAVTDAEVDAARVHNRGTYLAVCEHRVLVCSLLTPPGPRCVDCLDRLAPPRRRRAWWSWRGWVPGRHRAVAADIRADLAGVLDVEAGLDELRAGGGPRG